MIATGSPARPPTSPCDASHHPTPAAGSCQSCGRSGSTDVPSEQPEGVAVESTDIELDAEIIVVGAGMSGLYALKALRERGFRVIVLERAAGVGGTWFWNRYPGARCDIPSLEYSFGFDPELEQEWEWTEHFAGQPEIERYLNHITDRYDLRRDIRLRTGVAAT